jgi:hypothetical protein
MSFRGLFVLGILITGAAAPLSLFGQVQAPTQEELKMTSDPKAPGAAAVYLYREETEDDVHHFRTVYARLKVLTDAGKSLATVHVSYPQVLAYYATGDNSSHMSSGDANQFDAPDINQIGNDQPYDTDTYATNVEVKILDARTIHPDGTVIPFPSGPGSLTKVNTGAGQQKEVTFTLPAVEAGSILEYRYQVRYDRFQSAPEWQIQQPYFVHKAHYLFVPSEQFLPERNTIGAGLTSSGLRDRHYEPLTDIQSTNILPPGKSIIHDALGRYVIDLIDIPPIPQEPFAPPIAERIYQADFYYTYTIVEKEFWQKEMQYWTKDLNRYIATKPLLKSTVTDAVSPSDSPLDKAKKLYALVQKLKNTDLGIDPSLSTADDSIPRGNVVSVLETKAGNSNQLALLYLALAREAGLTARPVRIASRSRHVFSTSFLSTSQLDSVLIYITIDGKEIPVDPGTKAAPFQTLHWSHAAAGGVALTTNNKVETILTPLQQIAENTSVRVGSLNVSPQGAITGILKVGFTGQQAIEFRQLALLSGVDAVKDQLNKTIAAQLPTGIEAHVDRIANFDDLSKQLVALVPVSGSFTAQPGKPIALPRLFFETKETNPYPAGEARTLPIDARYPAQQQEQITWVLPAGSTLASAPKDVTEKWEDNALYQLHSKVDAASVTTLRVLAQGFTLLDPKDYAPLLSFYDKVVAGDQQQLLVNTPASGKGE